MIDVAEVRIWGELAGAVKWNPGRQIASFQYSENFLRKGIDLSPIKMPVKNGNRIYSFPELRRSGMEQNSTFKGLPGLLADSLPDRYGNQLIDMWLAQNGRLEGSMNPVEQLCFIGDRGMGALQFEPAQFQSDGGVFSVEVETLVNVAKKALSQKEKVGVNLHEDEKKAMNEILKIGTSAGGARPKAVIAFNKKTGEIKSGQAAVPDGFEHWLIKLDGVSDAQFGTSHGFGRVEFAYYLMARDCGVLMMESELLEENGRAHFMTKRFDRDGSNRHHIQTFCSIRHFDYSDLYSFSYEQLFQTMRMLKMTYPETEQMFRRMVFNVMSTNYDDHTKNFSFMLKQGGKWELAPAYDMCYSYDPGNDWVSQHTLSINGKNREITKSDLMTVADANGVGKGEKIINEIKETVGNWQYYAQKAGVPDQLKKSIAETLAVFKFQG
ncbi:MAG TPA: type II toxin-antitoxin system HipA family toxin [bacterium]|nr:type II toxin-antitoxin system HipA family toxin [bacterium]